MAQTHSVGAEGRNSYKFPLGGTELSLSWSTNKLQIALSSSACEIHEILTRARHEIYAKNVGHVSVNCLITEAME